jgi:tetratricopeptide (TPR) repeat protein
VLSVAVPERAAAIRIRAEARARLLDALDGERDIGLGPAPDVLLEQAIARYQAVLQVFPDDVDAWLELGRAEAEFERTMADGRLETRALEAIASYEHARALDPGRDPVAVADELAVLRTRLGDYAGAEAEYERASEGREALPLGFWHSVSRREGALVLAFIGFGQTTRLANWAEVTMLAGDPTAAAERYRSAFAQAQTASVSAALALWGLALAQARSGSHADAIETALRAIDTVHAPDSPLVDRYGAFAVLHMEGVFFEPACEIHAYESLGHEALATRASTPEGRVAEWTAARLSARFFLAEGGRASPYAAIATEAEARLTRLLGR